MYYNYVNKVMNIVVKCFLINPDPQIMFLPLYIFVYIWSKIVTMQMKKNC